MLTSKQRTTPFTSSPSGRSPKMSTSTYWIERTNLHPPSYSQPIAQLTPWVPLRGSNNVSPTRRNLHPSRKPTPSAPTSVQPQTERDAWGNWNYTLAIRLAMLTASTGRKELLHSRRMDQPVHILPTRFVLSERRRRCWRFHPKRLDSVQWTGTGVVRMGRFIPGVGPRHRNGPRRETCHLNTESTRGVPRLHLRLWKRQKSL